MAIAFRQSASAVIAAASGDCVITGVLAGSLLVVDVRVNGSSETITITDDVNAGSYANDETRDTGSIIVTTRSMPNSAAGTVTVHSSCTGGITVTMIAVHEYTGAVSASPKDKSVSATTASTTTPSSGSVATTSQADEMVHGAVAFPSPDDSNNVATGSLTNFRLNVSARLWTGDAILSATGTPSAGFTLGVAHVCGVTCVTYKAAASNAGRLVGGTLVNGTLIGGTLIGASA